MKTCGWERSENTDVRSYIGVPIDVVSSTFCDIPKSNTRREADGTFINFAGLNDDVSVHMDHIESNNVVVEYWRNVASGAIIKISLDGIAVMAL